MQTSEPYFVPPRPEVLPLAVRSALRSDPNAAFVIGEAPDGLPLALLVTRRIDVRAIVESSLRGRLDGAAPPELERAIGALDGAVRSFVLGRGRLAAGGAEYYETRASVGALLGSTLLTRMLGEASPAVVPEGTGPTAGRAESRAENSGLLNLRELAQVQVEAAVAATTGRDARLWAALDGDALLAVPQPVAGKDDVDARAAHARPVVWESLMALRSARYEVARDLGFRSGVTEGRLRDATYARGLAPATYLRWSVSRQDVGTLLVELARSVERVWHARGRVHCDLKPGNVLLRRDGIDAFDPLDVAVGEASLGLTLGWAAPEQVMAQPVTCATDVYAIGLMIASLVGAAIFGEERSIVIPARGQGRRRVRLFADPDVWLDPERVPLPTEARLAWRALLVRALAFAPERRPASGEAIASELATLLERYELPGRLSVACGPGHLRFEIGGDEPLWVLSDTM